MSLEEEILNTIGEARDVQYSSGELARKLNVGKSTTKRHLDQLINKGLVIRKGMGKATRYTLAEVSALAESLPQHYLKQASEAEQLLAYLNTPLTLRDITGYVREFVDEYIPNQTFLLPKPLAQTLMEEGRMAGQQPAGTYARKVLEQLLIDLSWSSSRLEGNRYSLLATEELFRSGTQAGDIDAVMLLNHKQAIEFLVDSVPQFGLTPALIRNLHSILMRDLLPDAASLGSIRTKIVNISDSTYIPLQVPTILEELFNEIIDKACQIKNPVESSFFLWVHLAYLQPFEDGNKRTSRLAANIPLMINNNAPLSFLDADPTRYAYAMMGVYEKRNMALAVELFELVYRRSIKKYTVTLEAMGIPDPFRLRYREALNQVIGTVVLDRNNVDAVIAEIGIDEHDVPRFSTLVQEELRVLDVFNCARYRLTMGQVKEWVDDGRPQ
jgi:fido (protein-threonine AMPylation protein)/DNA-binding transcriptional ArsR family regulator